MIFSRAVFLFGCIVRVFGYNSINDHWDEKLRQTKTEIAKLYFREDPPVHRTFYNVKWDQVWHHGFDNERPFIADTFDEILLIKGNKFVTFSPGATPSNRTLPQDIIAPSNRSPIKFTRSIVWKTVIYLLICYPTGSCGIYTGTDYSHLRHRQIIQHKGYPTDACFFVLANRLYLVVADNSGQYAVPSVIYHWRGTYMDAITEVMTISAVAVTAFKYKQSIIIIFAQNDGTMPGLGSTVYEFRDDDPDQIQFLPTSNPTSVHHYSHGGFNFILLVNERGPGNLFWWDGHELLNWVQIAEIRAPSLVHIANINDDTFFLVGYDSTLKLYKFGNASDCTLLSSMRLRSDTTLVDVQIRIVESTIIMVLVVVDKNNVYSVESWELRMEEIPSERSNNENDVLSKHLEELIDILQQKKSFVEEAAAVQPLLLPANEDLTISEPLNLPNLILDSGTVKNIHVFVDEEIIAPRELQDGIENLMAEVDDILTNSRELLTPNDTNPLEYDIVVEGDAVIEELQIDKMDADFVNDINMHTIDARNPEKSVKSPNLLRANNIVVRDLKVDSICGIPFEYWALKNDTSKMEIPVGWDKIEFSGDTIYLHSNVSLINLSAEEINDTNIRELFNELFIVGDNQKIRGNIAFTNQLKIQNLTVQTFNEIPWEHYMNTVTNQSFEKFTIKSIHVDELYADTINGVPVSEAARISMENVIKGEAKVAKVVVTDELIADLDAGLPEIRQLQIYTNVTVRGNVNIETLDIHEYTEILINGEKIDLNDIFDTYWTKSTDQVIANDVAFENNLVVDRLNVKYLDGFSEDEFLYTTATTIPENFRNLHFENVRIDGMFFTGEEKDALISIAPESITIPTKVHVNHLRGKQLLTDTFNGISVSDILEGKQPLIFPENMHFSTVRAEQINVDDLKFRSLNNESDFNLLESMRNLQEGPKATFFKASSLNVEHLNVETINGLAVEKLLRLKTMNVSDVKNLIINGDLIVKGDLKINKIDDQSPGTYIRNLAQEDIVIDSKVVLDELVGQNVIFKSLHGHDVKNLFEGFLSKSKVQVVPGQFSFYKVSADNINTTFINDQDTSEFLWINEPLFLTGNVTFDDLYVEGNIATNTLNDRNVNELYQNMLNASAKRIGDIRVDGNIFWDVPSTSASSLTFLFGNAVTKNTNQTILGKVTFQKDASASTIAGQWKGIDEIQEIIADAVVDDGDIIEIFGPKVFKKDLVVDTLSVAGDIGISTINDVDILEFNNSAVKRGESETITGSLTFLEEAAVTKILVNDEDHSVPLKGVVLATDMLPPVIFRDLELRDVYVRYFDGIELNEFFKNRITTDGSHQISNDVQFNGIVDVTGNANLSSINGLDPFDLVLNGTERTQVISGSKIFEEHVVVNGNIYAPFVNGANISSEYSNGIQNDEDVEIFGDLIFETIVKVPENVSVSQGVNGINLQTIVEDLQEEARRTLETFAQEEIRIEESIMQSSLISETLKNIVSYLDTEKSLKIEAPNIKKVRVIYYERVTKLNMIGEEPGPRCGLPINCSCPVEYVAELDDHSCRIKRTNGSKIVRNFHEPHSTFGVNLITNTVSYNRECTLNSREKEFIKISWMKSETIESGDVLGNVKETTSEINGFIKDAEVFMTHDSTAFIVLAVYYDTSLATHHTNSVIYKINFEKNDLSLHQKLPTDGAWAVEVFKINHYEIYLLLGCFGESEISFLYKLDPITSKFILARTFGGKARNARSLVQEEERFILLDDFDTNALNIFRYDLKERSFYDYQSLFHDSRIHDVECFYADEFGRSDSFIVVATENDQFYIYEYMYAQKFQLKVQHQINDLQAMVPFHYLNNHYIFVGTSTNSTVLKIVKQGPH